MEDISQRSHTSYCRGFQGIPSLNTNTFSRPTQKKTEDIISWIRDVYIVVRKKKSKYYIKCFSWEQSGFFFQLQVLKTKFLVKNFCLLRIKIWSSIMSVSWLSTQSYSLFIVKSSLSAPFAMFSWLYFLPYPICTWTALILCVHFYAFIVYIPPLCAFILYLSFFSLTWWNLSPREKTDCSQVL